MFSKNQTAIPTTTSSSSSSLSSENSLDENDLQMMVDLKRNLSVSEAIKSPVSRNQRSVPSSPLSMSSSNLPVLGGSESPPLTPSKRKHKLKDEFQKQRQSVSERETRQQINELILKLHQFCPQSLQEYQHSVRADSFALDKAPNKLNVLRRTVTYLTYLKYGQLPSESEASGFSKPALLHRNEMSQFQIPQNVLNKLSDDQFINDILSETAETMRN